jgi:hypothetical protein
MPLAALLMASVTVAPQLPSFDFTGLPQILWSGDYAIETANARLTLGKDAAGKPAVTVSTLVTLKTQDKPFPGRILVPRRRWGDTQSGNPGWNVRFWLDGKSVALRPISERGSSSTLTSGVTEYISDLAFDQRFLPRRTYVIKTEVTLPIGKTGYEGKERATGYFLGGEVSADQLQISFAYSQNEIFGLPNLALGDSSGSVFEKSAVQVGNQGAFLRLNKIKLPGDLVTFRYFPPALN